MPGDVGAATVEACADGVKTALASSTAPTDNSETIRRLNTKSPSFGQAGRLWIANTLPILKVASIGAEHCLWYEMEKQE
jgi:hypothetical protein